MAPLYFWGNLVMQFLFTPPCLQYTVFGFQFELNSRYSRSEILLLNFDKNREGSLVSFQE